MDSNPAIIPDDGSSVPTAESHKTLQATQTDRPELEESLLGKNTYPPDDEDNEGHLAQTNRVPPIQFSVRSIALGCAIGALVSAMNVNFGLRTGWTQGGSIFAAIIGIGFFKVLRINSFSMYETVMTTTAASAAGTMTSAAGLVSSIPALKMLGYDYDMGSLFLWAFSLAFFGMCFAVPLRHQMLEVEKLRFPSGTATGETIKVMFTKGAETVEKARTLVVVAFSTAFYALLAFFVPYFENPPMPATLRQWGFVLAMNPLLFGGGMLAGIRATSSLMIGTILGWAILGPIVYTQAWAVGPVLSYTGVRGWILWVGVAIMTADSLTQLIFTIPMIFRGFYHLGIQIRDSIRSMRSGRGGNSTSLQDAYADRAADHQELLSANPLADNETDFDGDTLIPANPPAATDRLEPEPVYPIGSSHPANQIPMLWVVCLILMASVSSTLIGHFIFGIEAWNVLISIPLSFLLAVIAARCAGETDINPVGGMGKVTQLVFAGIAPKNTRTNLLAAGIVGAGASQCGDMMQDLKTGQIIGASPRFQFIAQAIGIVAGIIFCVPIYKLFDSAYTIGGPEIPAPAAHAWKAVAEILANGLSSLPINSGYGIIGGAIFGLVNALISKFVAWKKPEWSHYIPSSLAIGIAMIVPAKQSIMMFLGSIFYLCWKKLAPKKAELLFFPVASGMIAGEGLMGVLIALLKLAGAKPFFTIPPVAE